MGGDVIQTLLVTVPGPGGGFSPIFSTCTRIVREPCLKCIGNQLYHVYLIVAHVLPRGITGFGRDPQVLCVILHDFTKSTQKSRTETRGTQYHHRVFTPFHLSYASLAWYTLET